MKKLTIRLTAALLGVVVAFATIQPIQAQRLAAAICSNDAGTIYSFVQYVGYTREEVDEIAAYTETMRSFGIGTCSSGTVRGAYFDIEGNLSWIVYAGEQLYILNFDATGRLEAIQ